MRTKLKTERLTLRKFEDNRTDSDSLWELLGDPLVTETGFYGAPSLSRAQSDQRLLACHLRFGWTLTDYAVFLPYTDVIGTRNNTDPRTADGTFIGSCGIELGGTITDVPEVEYCLKPDQWGKGYVREALKEVVKEFFKHSEDDLVGACPCTGNSASINVLTSIGFKLQAPIGSVDVIDYRFDHRVEVTEVDREVDEELHREENADPSRSDSTNGVSRDHMYYTLSRSDFEAAALVQQPAKSGLFGLDHGANPHGATEVHRDASM